MNPTRRVVITGTGLVTALGTGIKKSWHALVNGQSGIARITRFDTGGLKASIAGEVRDFDATAWLDRKDVRRMDLFCQYALAAAEMAIQESALPIGINKPGGYQAERVGVIVGSGIGGLMSFEETHTTGMTKGWDRLSPFFILKMIANMAAGHISIRYACKGPNWGPVSACSTSAHAIGEAFMAIRHGSMDACITGGSEAAISPMGIGGFEAMKALSTNTADPVKASRPFDKHRDGFVMGEGAGIIVLEELEHARARGATVLSEVVSYAANSDAYHETQPAPEGEGAVRCMQLALNFAGLQPHNIGYVNAHGTSTPFNDANETKAIKTVFGAHAHKLFVSSTKSMTGHMLGASGGAEVIITTLALTHGVLPPTINYETPDPDCDLNYIPNQAREVNIDTAMSNSFGFGGTNAVVILKNYRE